MILETANSGSLVLDETVRVKPIVHPAATPPLCDSCQRKNIEQFSLECSSCLEDLLRGNFSIPELFAVLRIWTPHAQNYLEVLIKEILKKGANVNDRDGITDMTMLHYASKSGAMGVGNVDDACRVVSLLLSMKANVFVRSRWTDMAAIHFAVFFDVAPVVEILLAASRRIDVNSRCSRMENGTLLHIAATNFAWKTIQVLVKNGANTSEKDDLGRLPLECIAADESLVANSPTAIAAEKTRQILAHAMLQQQQQPLRHWLAVALKEPVVNEPIPLQQQQAIPTENVPNGRQSAASSGDGQRAKQGVRQSPATIAGNNAAAVAPSTGAREAHMSVGLRVGEKVLVAGVKSGTLRFCGMTKFATGLWAGIELDEPVGKNNGSVGGVQYFVCQQSYGIFAPLSKVTRLVAHPPSSTPPAGMAAGSGKINTTHVTAKVNTGLADASRRGLPNLGIEVGDRVVVAGQKLGTVLFVGNTTFAPGCWYGIELDQPIGRNDGSINGTRYFTCEANRGVFAPPSRVQKFDNSRPASDVTQSDLMKRRRLSGGSSASTRNLSNLNNMKTSRPYSSNAALSSSRRSVPTISKPPGSKEEFFLREGMTVYCNGDVGVIRYIGEAEFAPGLWLGVELKSPRGRNDGSVHGHRYFTCRQGHGLMVRPTKVTVKGISGAKLLSPQQQKMADLGPSPLSAPFSDESRSNYNGEGEGHGDDGGVDAFMEEDEETAADDANMVSLV